MNKKKLTYEDIVFIFENPTMGRRVLGKKFNVDPKTIKSIRHGKIYKKEFEIYNVLERKDMITPRSDFYDEFLKDSKKSLDLPEELFP